jgi:hypothetical protein
MADKMDYKKIRTDIINGKKRCIYMKPKGKREYVKSGGEFVSLSAYIKTLQKKNKKKGGGLFDCFGFGNNNNCKKEPITVTAELGVFNHSDITTQSPPDKGTTTQLPHGWEERISKRTQQPYYFNKKTGVTTWEHPEPPKPSKPRNPDTYLRRGEKFGAFLKKSPAKIGPNGEFIPFRNTKTVT